VVNGHESAPIDTADQRLLLAAAQAGAPLDAVRVSPGVTRTLEAGDDGLEILVFGPHVESDAESVHERRRAYD
jgi:hypothetical protein